MQGGAHNGTIAGITQALFEADTKEFKEYANQILVNAKTLANELAKFGFKIVSGGTDKHLVLIDLRGKDIGGKYVARALAHANIVSNMNTVPYESGSPLNPSGLRIGSPTVTTRGMKVAEMKQISEWINKITNIAIELKNKSEDFQSFDKLALDNKQLKDFRKDVVNLCHKFPLHQ